jgi:hypothetical protein
MIIVYLYLSWLINPNKINLDILLISYKQLKNINADLRQVLV